MKSIKRSTLALALVMAASTLTAIAQVSADALPSNRVIQVADQAVPPK